MAGVSITINNGLNGTLFGNYFGIISDIIRQQCGVSSESSQLGELFAIKKGKRYKESVGGVTALGVFEPVGEMQPGVQDSVQDLPVKDFIYQEWVKKIVISKRALQFEETDLIEEQATAFADSFYTTRDELAAEFYGQALQGNSSFRRGKAAFDITTRDKKPLFASNHNSAVAPSRTQGNVFSDAFSVDALGKLTEIMNKFEGDTKNRLNVSPDTIIIPNDEALKNSILEVLGAKYSPNDNRNAFNYKFGLYNLIVVRNLDKYITAGSKPWILLDSKYLKLYSPARWYDWSPLTVESWEDKGLRASIWQGEAQFSAGFADWQFAIAGGVAGSPTALS